MEPAPPAERKRDKLRRRSSILKMPVPTSPDEETEELTSRRGSRRVSFANRFHVQEFCSDEVTVTRWAEAYEREAHVTDSSGEASAAALAASHSPLLDATHHLNVSMDLTDVEKSFVLAPVDSFPAVPGDGAFEAALGPVPSFLREDSDPDKENMVPRRSATSAAGVGFKARSGLVIDPMWPVLDDRAATPPPPPVSVGGLLELPGGSDVATPPFLRRPAPGGVLDLLLRAGIVSESPASPSPTSPAQTCQSRRSALELLGGVEKVATPPFLRYLNTLEDDMPSHGRVAFATVQQSDTVRESADMEITTAAVSQRLIMTTSSDTVEMSQIEATGSIGREAAGGGFAGVVDGTDEQIHGGMTRTGRPTDLVDRTRVDGADMELTSAVPRDLSLVPEASLSKSVVDASGMELTVAVPQALGKQPSVLDQTTGNGDDMELTAAAVSQTVHKPPSRSNKSIGDGTGNKLTADVPEVMQNITKQLSKTIVGDEDMEMTSTLPQPVAKTTDKPRHSDVNGTGTELELSASVPSAVLKPSSLPDKSILDEVGMELTSAVPQEMSPNRLSSSVVGSADMTSIETTAQPVTNTSAMLSKGVEDGVDMQLTASAPHVMQKSTAALNKSIVDGADMDLTAAVPQVMHKLSSQSSDTVVEDSDMEITSAVPRPLMKTSHTSSKSIAGGVGADSELIASALPETLKPPSLPSKSILDGVDVEPAAAIPQATSPNRLSSSVADDASVTSTESVPHPTTESSVRQNRSVVDSVNIVDAAAPHVTQKPTGALNKSIVDGADMELTAAVPQEVMQSHSVPLSKTTVEDLDMEVTSAVSQPVEQTSRASIKSVAGGVIDGGELIATVLPVALKPSGTTNKSIVDGVHMELTSAVPLEMSSTRLSSSIAEGANMTPTESLAQPATEPGMDTEVTAADPQIMLKSSADLNNSTGDAADMELTTAVPHIMRKPSSELCKTVMEDADMEITSAVPLPVMKTSGGPGKDVSGGADAGMELATDGPLAELKPSSPLNGSIVDGADMELTAAVPQTTQRHPSMLRQNAMEDADTEVASAVPLAVTSASSDPNKNLVGETDVELTAVQQTVLNVPNVLRNIAVDDVSSERLNKTSIDRGNEEATVAIMQTPTRPGQVNETLVDGANMEETIAVPQKVVPKLPTHISKISVQRSATDSTFPSPKGCGVARPATKMSNRLNMSAADAVERFALVSVVPQVVVTAEHEELTNSPSDLEQSSQPNRTIVREAEMEKTAVLPQLVAKTSTQANKTTLDVTGMELTAAIPQVSQSHHLNKSFLDGSNMELTVATGPTSVMNPDREKALQVRKGIVSTAHKEVAVQEANIKSSSQMSKTLAVEADMEMTEAVPQRAVHLSADADKTTTDGACTDEVEPIPLPMSCGQSNEVNQTVMGEEDAEITAAIPQPVVPLTAIAKDESMAGEACDEAVASHPQSVAETHGRMTDDLNTAEMAVARVVSRPFGEPSNQVNERKLCASSVEVGTAAVQTALKPSQMSRSIIGETETASAPRIINLDPPNRGSEANLSVSNEAVTVPQVDAQKPSNMTVMDGADREITAEVVLHESAKLSSPVIRPKTVAVHEEGRVTTPQSVNLSTQINRTVVDPVNLERTSTAGELVTQSASSELNKSILNGKVVEAPTAAEADRSMPISSVQINRASLDGEGMEITGAISPVTIPESSQASEGETRETCTEVGASPQAVVNTSTEAAEACSVVSPEGTELPVDPKCLQDTDTPSVLKPSVETAVVGGNSEGHVVRPDVSLPVTTARQDVEVVHGTLDAYERAPSSIISDSVALPALSASSCDRVNIEQHPSSSGSEELRLNPSQDAVAVTVMDVVSSSVLDCSARVPACRRPAVDSPRRPLPKRGRLLVDTRTPSPSKRQLDEPKESSPRLPKSPRLEEIAENGSELGKASRVDALLEDSSTNAPLDVDLFDESFPNISVFNDSFCAAGQRAAASPSAGRNISRPIAERDQSYLSRSVKDGESQEPSRDAVRKQIQRRSSPPLAEQPGWRRGHERPNQRRSRVTNEATELKQCSTLEETSRSRSQLMSPERKRPQPLDEAPDRPCGLDRLRCSGSDAEAARRASTTGGRDLPAPLRLPNCKSLVRSLQAHLEAYRRAREAGERAVQEAVEAVLSRRRPAQ